MAGVIPAIFASSVILFPGTIAAVVWSDRRFRAGYRMCRLALQPGQPLHMMLYAAAIIFFCFFYTALDV